MSTTLKETIRDYIEEIGGFNISEIQGENIDFGFSFRYPNPRVNRNFHIVKPIRRNRVEIFSITNLTGSHLEEFSNLNDTEKKEFLKGLERIILQNVLSRSFRFGSDPPGYNVIKMLYLENKTLSLNRFYHTIRRIWSCVMLSVMYIQDFFSGEYNPEDYNDNTPSYHI